MFFKRFQMSNAVVVNLTQGTDLFYKTFTTTDHYLISPHLPITSYFLIFKHTVNNVVKHFNYEPSEMWSADL